MLPSGVQDVFLLPLKGLVSGPEIWIGYQVMPCSHSHLRSSEQPCSKPTSCWSLSKPIYRSGNMLPLPSKALQLSDKRQQTSPRLPYTRSSCRTSMRKSVDTRPASPTPGIRLTRLISIQQSGLCMTRSRMRIRSRKRHCRTSGESRWSSFCTVS